MNWITNKLNLQILKKKKLINAKNKTSWTTMEQRNSSLEKKKKKNYGTT